MPTKRKNPKPKAAEHIVVDEDGTEYILHGYGWAKEFGVLDLDPRIDLTKPIWEQIQRLDRLDKRQEQRSKAAA